MIITLTPACAYENYGIENTFTTNTIENNTENIIETPNPSMSIEKIYNPYTRPEKEEISSTTMVLYPTATFLSGAFSVLGAGGIGAQTVNNKLQPGFMFGLPHKFTLYQITAGIFYVISIVLLIIQVYTISHESALKGE